MTTREIRWATPYKGKTHIVRTKYTYKGVSYVESLCGQQFRPIDDLLVETADPCQRCLYIQEMFYDRDAGQPTV